jgi:broad specificity phosphatase PhoE
LVVSTRWPRELVLVRHAESTGNLADSEARSQGAERLEIDLRDADVPLSSAGREQAEALGRFMTDVATGRSADLVVSSPYRRAAETAERAVAASGWSPDLVVDERLRERDLGAFDRLTSVGIEAQFAEEAERRRHVGKFYYQPPSGESWCDVTLRIRSLLADLREGYAGKRVWLFTHQAVIMSVRYVLESLTEQELLDIDRSQRLPNCSLTTYRAGGQGMELVSFATTEAVDRSAAEVTAEPSKAERATHAR